MNNSYKYFNHIIKRIMNSRNIVIYGAGTMGKALKKCLTEHPYDLTIECFLVNSLSENPPVVDNINVYDLRKAKYFQSSLVLVALNEKMISKAVNDLEENGFTNILPISFDGDAWTSIRGNWIAENVNFGENVIYLSEIGKTVGNSNRVMHIFVIHSIYDRIIKSNMDLHEFEIPIQVGAALTDTRLFEITDINGDDNISEKNRQYCELTGIYWAWKHDYSKYIGFSHYRRRFALNPNEINYITSGNVDIVVTEPILNFISVKSQYAKDHCSVDWDILMEAIEHIYPDYSLAAQKVQNGIYYFAYNMFIMKKEVFDNYCRFIFPVLEYCESKIGVKEDTYQNRYIGFLAERLLSIFIEGNNQYKVVIADKTFLE